MGIWKLPKTKSEAEELRDVLSRGLRADEASDTLYGVLGSDDLFDRISAARKAHPSWDVRSLVVNAVTEIYFTGQPASEIASAETVDILRHIVDITYDNKRDVFFDLAKARSADEAISHAAWALEINKKDIDKWSVVRDHQNLDFIVLGPEGSLHRVNAFDGVVMDIDDSNRGIYEPLFVRASAATI